jgi:Nuclease-related domain
MHDHPLDHHNSWDRLDRSQPQRHNGAIHRGAGLTVRAYTAEELRARLSPPTPPEPVLPATITAPATPAPAAPPVDADKAGAGASARAEYRRRRAAELARWAVGLPWRLALVAAAALAGHLLASHTGLLEPWLASLAAGAGAGWRLRFRASQPTRAWADGARGERATARRLRRLERHGYMVLHDLQVPGSRANLDHLAVGPAGVFVIDSKRFEGRLSLGADGMLWYGRYPLAQQLATAVWATLRVAEALQVPPEVPVVPLLVIHRAAVPWGGLTVAGVQVIPPTALADTLGRDAIVPAAQVAVIAGQATVRLHPAG